jgi:hypothetical protein
VAGFRTFVAGIGTGNTCRYCITDGTDWEVGTGTVTDASPDTLARTAIIASTNSNNAVNWGAGSKTVFCDYPAQDIAGQSIAELGGLGAGQIANTDILVLVDVSDTTQSAAGSTKSITRQNLIDPNNLAAYAAGTVYTLTNSVAKVDFGTTDPGVTVNAAGVYRLMARILVKYNAATFAANQTLTLKIRRTNNTAADITNTTTVRTLPIVTAITDSMEILVPVVFYTTTNTNDAIELHAGLSAAPGAGSLTVEEASIIAERVY